MNDGLYKGVIAAKKDVMNNGWFTTGALQNVEWITCEAKFWENLFWGLRADGY